MKHATLGIAVLLGLYALHRVAVWAEGRGWIHYRSRRGSSGALGNALLEVHAMLEPSQRYVLEEKTKEDADAAESGDPPERASQ